MKISLILLISISFFGCNRQRTNPYDPVVFVKPLWVRTFGLDGDEEGNRVLQTSDGGYVIASTTHRYCAVGNMWLIKTDAYGNKSWEKTFGTTAWDATNSLDQTQDGGYIIAGGTKDRIWLIKVDSLGNQLWDGELRFSDTCTTYLGECRETTDGGYILAATVYYPYYRDCQENSDVWLVKTDGQGSLIWDKTFGGESYDRGCSVIQTSDGGYMIAGNYGLGGGSTRMWLTKTDVSGNQCWSETIDHAYDAVSICQTPDGGYIACGVWDGVYEAVLVKTDAVGAILWHRKFGAGSRSRFVGSLSQTPDGGCILNGVIGGYYPIGLRDAFLVKTDGSGSTLWDVRFDGGSDDCFSNGCLTDDGCYVVTGYTSSYGANDEDVLLMKIAIEP